MQEQGESVDSFRIGASPSDSKESNRSSWCGPLVHVFVGPNALPCFLEENIADFATLDPSIRLEPAIESQALPKGVRLELLIQAIPHRFDVATLFDRPATPCTPKDLRSSGW